jgi:hypothetical protein
MSMNRYGQMALDYQRENLPAEFVTIPDSERFFTTAGEEIAASVGAVRDQILGLRQAGESAEEFRHRSSQASATAEELVLADHHLLTGESRSETEEPAADDPELAAYQRDLAEANEAILRLYE